MPGVIDGLKAVHLWLDHSRWMVKPSVSVRTHWLCYIISYYISTSTPMLVTGNPHKAHGKLTCISILLFPVYWPPYDTCHIHPVRLHTDDRGFLGFSILLNDTWVGGEKWNWTNNPLITGQPSLPELQLPSSTAQTLGSKWLGTNTIVPPETTHGWHLREFQEFVLE